MTIRTLALANLKRRRSKTVLMSVGIAIGIGTAVALLTLSTLIRQEIGAQLDQFGANIVVLPKSDSLSLSYGGISISNVSFDAQQLSEEDAKQILEIPYRARLSVIAPKLLGGIQIDGRQVLLAGVDFDSELRLKRWWQIIGRRPSGEGEVLIGFNVARAMGIVEDDGAAPAQDSHDEMHSPDVSGVAAPASSTRPAPRLLRDRLHLDGSEYAVAGVIAPTAGPEDGMIFASLPAAQALLRQPGRLSLIEVSALCKDCPVGDIVAQIAAQLPHARATAVQQSVQAREQAVAQLARFSAAVSGVVLAVAALLVFTTMTGAVLERTKEIGVLRALGFRRAHIVRGLMIEICVVSVLGGLIGWALGTASAWTSLPYFAETPMPFEPRWMMAPAALGGALLVGILSSLRPIVRAARLDPVEAVRYA